MGVFTRLLRAFRSSSAPNTQQGYGERGEEKDNLLGHGLLQFCLEVPSSSQQGKAF